MKKHHRIILGVLGFFLCVIAVAAFVVDAKYAVVWSGPRISHEQFCGADTRLRIVFKPHHALSDVTKLLIPNREVSDWLAARVLPQEMALLVDRGTEGGLPVRFFVNEKRLGPMIVQAMNQGNTPPSYPGLTWSPPQTIREKRGVLLKKGALEIKPELLSLVEKQWGVVLLPNPLRIEGDHLFEAVLDNRDGGGFAILMALLGPQGADTGPLGPDKLVPVVKDIANIRLFADQQSDTMLKIHLRVDGDPAADETKFETLLFFINFGYQSLRTNLSSAYGAELTGSVARKGLVIEGDYVLANYQRLFQRGMRTASTKAP